MLKTCYNGHISMFRGNKHSIKSLLHCLGMPLWHVVQRKLANIYFMLFFPKQLLNITDFPLLE